MLLAGSSAVRRPLAHHPQVAVLQHDALTLPERLPLIWERTWHDGFLMGKTGQEVGMNASECVFVSSLKGTKATRQGSTHHQWSPEARSMSRSSSSEGPPGSLAVWHRVKRPGGGENRIETMYQTHCIKYTWQSKVLNTEVLNEVPEVPVPERSLIQKAPPLLRWRS